ncbi:NAD(P)-dependent dehydrogenase (short-subunit alcohol dehydrogenase family) [Burkholderia sp. OAS925]|uniref:SDR family NAD(P)-dependent oxidoreductase n=1 Tax=Paraburkholderia TaxID=1822464 RepID=UPI00178AD898|nr:SDR family NAD(P)-dependent oxidoreductase [Paraburkholderia graminis]MDR6478854.1 3-oxoacyl-[acyl-carrier protein] reductase [Paraburkholderia graminis]
MSTWNMESAVVPVTGAASGIGLAVCERLRAEGATPLLLDWDEQKLHAAAEKLYHDSEGSARYCYLVDVRNSRAVDECFANIARTHGPATHAVAAAGIVNPADILSLTDESWQQVLDVNLNGAMYFCRAAARQLAEAKRGSIVNIASIGGLSARESRVSYVASKAAMINMTRAMAIDLGEFGVRVNAVAPGVIDTPIQNRNRGTFQNIAEGVALKRIGTPEEVANVTLFLLSDFASYVTGTTVVVDGGMTASYR